MAKAFGKYWIDAIAETVGEGREKWQGSWKIFDKKPTYSGDDLPIAEDETPASYDTPFEATDAAEQAAQAHIATLP